MNGKSFCVNPPPVQPVAITLVPGSEMRLRMPGSLDPIHLPPLPAGGYVVDSVRLLKPGAAYRWHLAPDGRATLREVPPPLPSLHDSLLQGPVEFTLALVRHLLAWARG